MRPTHHRANSHHAHDANNSNNPNTPKNLRIPGDGLIGSNRSGQRATARLTSVNLRRFLNTRLLVMVVAIAMVATILSVTAYMQQPLDMPQTAKPDLPVTKDAKPGKGKPADARSEAKGDKSQSVGARQALEPNLPAAAGTCNDVLPALSNIEVEATNVANNLGYSTLQAAFAAINSGTHTGVVTIDVCGNTTETGIAVLNQVAAVTSVTMSPAGGAARTITGAIASGSPLINLNGADNVTINGLNTGGNSLTISNTTIGATSTTAGTSTIRFIADATNNTVTNTTILGSSNTTLATAAGTVFFSTGTTTGNDNNTISNCSIGPAGANLPSKAIMASGTSSAIENDNVMISGNNIFDFFNVAAVSTASTTGINILTGNEAWTISNNKFYQTATRTFGTTALRYGAITLNNTTGGFTVSGNTIGFASAAGTGTTTITGSSNEFRGIDVTNVRTTAPATEIQNNIISGISQTSSRGSTTFGSSAFIAVGMGTSDGLVNATGNTIGSLDGSSTIVLNHTSTTASTAPAIGFYNFSFFNTNISSNNIGAITIQSTGTVTGFRGIYINTGTGLAATINNNTIGGSVVGGAITDTQVGSYVMYGIQVVSANVSASGNIIRNMSGASNAAATIVSSGILASGSSGANTISQNTIHSLSNASGAGTGAIYGISLSLPTTTNLIERNLIHSFSLTATVAGTQIWGISGGTTGTATYKNNMIRLGINAAGTSVTLPSSVIGIRDSAGATNQFYHNSIYIGGTGVLAAPTPSNSYCFFSDVVTVTRAYQDNIFWNARSNAVAGGVAHIAIRVGGTAPNPPGLTSNYNDLYFSGTDGATGVFNAAVVPTLAAWRTATGQDANSIAADPQFVNPTGTAATVDLHIHATNPTPIESAGLAIGSVTDDYDGQGRAALTPTDIGADAGNFVAAPLFFRSVASGNWNATSTWEQSVDGVNWAPAISTPTSASNTITIRSPHTVTVTAGVSADELTVNVGGTLVVNSGITLTIDDGTGTDLTVNGTANVMGTGVIGGAGSFTLSSGATLVIGSAAGITSSGATGSIQVAGARSFNTAANYTYNGSGAQVTGNGLPATVNNLTIITVGITNLTSDITIDGNFAIISAVLNATEFDALTRSVTMKGNYDNTLGIYSSAIPGLLTFAGTTVLTTNTANNDFPAVTIAPSSSLTHNTGTISVSGNWLDNASVGGASGHLGPAVTQFTPDGAVTRTIGGSVAAPRFGAVTIATTSGAIVQAAKGLDIDGFVQFLSGTFDDGGFNHTVLGDWIKVGGTTYTATGTITFDGAPTSNVQASNFNNLSVSKNSQATLVTQTGSITVAANLTVTTGTFNQGTAFDLTANAISVASGAMLRNFGTGDLTLSGNVSNSGSIDYNANGGSCGDADSILIRSSVALTQRTWSGTGTFTMTDVDVQDQRTPVVPPPVSIFVTSGTDSGNNTGWVFLGSCTAGTYVWTGTVSTDWQVPANWSPTRTLPAAGDILIFDGNATPGPLVTNVPTQTIAALRLINGTLVTLNASAVAPPHTLTVSGATGMDLTVPASHQLTLAGTNGLTINVASGSTATVGGLFLMQDGPHRLIGNLAGAITFQTGSICTTAPSYTSSVNPFGSSSTGGSVIFQTGSNYFHNNGDSPFGALVNPAIAVFQGGSTATWLSGNGFQGRTYSNLVIGNSSTATVISSSGIDPFEFDSLTVASTPIANSSLTFSDGGNINIKGDITSTGVGTGTAVSDVTLLSSTGIVIAKTVAGTINFSNSGGSTRTVSFGNATAGSGNATVVTGNTLALARKLIVDTGSVITVNGALSGSATGYVIGKEKRAYTGATPMFIYHVGSTNGYAPADVTVTAGTGDLTVEAKQPHQPMLNPATSLQRYWTLTEGGAITADLVFHYNHPPDVAGTESNYRLVIVEGGFATSFPENCPNVACVDESLNTIKRDGVQTFSDWTAAEPNAPTAVKLTGFTATRNGDEVMLEWQSGYEASNLGYNIYREQDGKRVQITPSLVAGSALIAGNRTQLTAGLSYSWFDEVPGGRGNGERVSNQQSAISNQQSNYWLEDVDLDGTRTLHGPIAVAECGRGNAACKKLSERSRLLSDLTNQQSAKSNQQSAISSQQSASGVEFSSGPATPVGPNIGIDPVDEAGDPSEMQRTIAGLPGLKISISRAGWYRITQPEVAEAGFDVADAKYLQLYRNGLEVPFKLSNTKNEFGPTDYFEFYGEGLSSPTDKAQTYYLVYLEEAGQRIRADKAGELGDPSGPQSFAYTVERKERMVYFSGLRNGDEENFFGQILSSTPTTATIPVSHIDAASQGENVPSQLEVVLQGVSSQSHLVRVRINGTDLGTVNFANTDHPIQTFSVPAAAIHNGNNTVELTSLGGTADISLVDVLRLTYVRSYAAENDALTFSVNSQETKRLTGFSNKKVRVVDVTDPYNPLELAPIVSQDGGGFAADIQVRASLNDPHTLVAFVEGPGTGADALRLNEPSSWWREAAGADYVIISAGNLKASVEPLAQLRRNQGLVVQAIDVEDLYDEFSFGKHSPQAIHDFLERAKTTWTRQPHYLLLAGDASYDPKNYFGQGLNDLVPTKLIDTALTETASDDWLGDFNGDGMADLSIGRLPLRTVAQTEALVAKIVGYENAAPDPSRGALLVADTGFEGPSSAVQSLLPAGMAAQVINRSSADDATIHNQIITGLNQGPLVANYIGHGSNGVWTGASLLSSNDAPALTNFNRLTVFTMMTCFNGFFQDAYNDSLSEALLKAPGGAVAVWASTTLTDPAGQQAIDQEFYRMVFGASR